jgi:hypothetical protein
MVHALISTASWKINQKKVQKAIGLVRDSEKTVKEAAEITGLTELQVQEGIKKHSSRNSGTTDQLITSRKSDLRARYTHFNKSLGKVVQDIFSNYRDGEVREAQVAVVFNYLGDLIKRSSHMYSNWDKRWRVERTGNK